MNPLKTKHYDYLIALLAYFIISLIVLGQILLSSGTIGFFHDWFIGPYHEMNKSWAKSGLYIWDSQIGYKVYDTDWIIKLILLPIPFLGGEILSKGLLILIMTLSGFGAFCLGRRLKLSWYASFAAGIIYIFSPIIFTRIIAGHLYYLIAYFLTPLILTSFLQGKEQNNKKYFIVAGLLLSLAVIQIQFLVLVFLILLIFTLLDFKQIKKAAIGLFIVISITFLISYSPILLPQLLLKGAELPFNVNQLLSYDALVTASDLAKSFRMLGYEAQPYSYLNLGTSNDLISTNTGLMPSWIFYLDFILPIIGFSVLLFRKDRYTISFAVIAIIGVFLLKGLNPPFPSVFEFLFKHGFYSFRELWHIAFLYCFAITFLIAIFIERILKLKFKLHIKVILSASLISMIVLANGYPLLLGNFAGYVQTYSLPSEYQTLYNKFSSDPNYNVLILPYVNPIRYDDLRLKGIDPFVTDTSNMIFPTHFGGRISPTNPASIWLLSSIQENKTDNLGKVLSGFGIKNVILRKDFVSYYPGYTPLNSLPLFRQKWNTPLEPILDSQNDLKVISNNLQYKIYENQNNVSKIFVPVTTAGGLSDFDSFLLLSKFSSLSNVSLYPSVSDRDSLIFIDDKREVNMSKNDFVDINKYANSFDAKKGWADSISSFGYDHILTSRFHQGLFSDSPNSQVSFELPNRYENKQVEIWVKALSWEQGGKINVQVDGANHTLPLTTPNRSFQLFKIFQGQSDKPYHILIQNLQGKNYLEGFYVKDVESQLNNSRNKIFLTNLDEDLGPNLVANSEFALVNNHTKLPLYWNDSLNNCGKKFTCKINATSGWNDKLSYQFSTKRPHNINGSWSSIYGQEIKVDPSKSYRLLTHMKMNKYATQSHVLLEGFNEHSRKWYQIEQCPAGIEGRLQWQQFSCEIKIPENTTKVRPVLNAGWSSQPKVARTWFDDLSLNELTNQTRSLKLAEIKKFSSSEGLGNKSSSGMTTNPEFNKVNPTLWNVHISTSRPTTIGFAEPYDEKWQAIVYKQGKKLDVVKPMPLYGAINGFQINQTGSLEIVVSFSPQYWYQVGFVISGVTFAFCIFYIIYDWRRKKEKPEDSTVSNNFEIP
jgi:hypothetical protein